MDGPTALVQVPGTGARDATPSIPRLVSPPVRVCACGLGTGVPYTRVCTPTPFRPSIPRHDARLSAAAKEAYVVVPGAARGGDGVISLFFRVAVFLATPAFRVPRQMATEAASRVAYDQLPPVYAACLSSGCRCMRAICN
ncbi:hypothetical protein RJ55_02864 [Drechmeria coniospora]|nr:hypothetical protein RJ55_02864 [Drechmeria coniospora]